MDSAPVMGPKLFSLEGKVALVTGAAGILGKPFCEGLAAFGADLVLVDLQQDTLEAQADTLRSQHGHRVLPLACDLTDPKAVDALVKQAVQHMGALHILHNNAASKGPDLRAFFEASETYAPEIWKDVMAVNVDAMFFVAQAVGRHMIERGQGGSIIQMGSIYGLVGPDQRIYEGSDYLGGPINTPAVYAASKGAVIQLTRYLAATWGTHGIRVNTLVPGGVESGQNPTFLKQYAQRAPLGRMAQAEEMVGALIYLASDASSYVTGHTLAVDGGWTAW
jgi:NAD(P)-dependent dehydrogenase (short-subunit alcohol dehydrogenase family)